MSKLCLNCSKKFYSTNNTTPKTVGKDKAENAYLTKCGYNLLRWSETDIKNKLPELLNQLN